MDSLTGRIAQLVADAGIDVGPGEPAEQLRRLADALGRQATELARRDAIREQLRRNGRRREKLEEAPAGCAAAAASCCATRAPATSRNFAAAPSRRPAPSVLRRDREELDREITATIAGHCPQEAVRRQLEGAAAGALEPRRDELLAGAAAAEQALEERFERRGRLAEQLKTLADDRQLARKQLDLAIVQQRLDEAVRRWQVLAATCRTLDVVRATFEQQRQPETLQEASGYLQRLTQGRYGRVWTPLGQHVLRVDDAEGHALPVEALSRGTREQLFLSLRLALAACYARRGAPLPLVLDDVLVNFDSRRAEAAAAVLRDFAAAGHQVLVFTCHEHMLRMFQSLKVPAGRLPDAREAGARRRGLRGAGQGAAEAAAEIAAAPRKTAARIKPPELQEEHVGDRLDEESGEDAPWDEAAEADFEDADDEDWDDDAAASWRRRRRRGLRASPGRKTRG